MKNPLDFHRQLLWHKKKRKPYFKQVSIFICFRIMSGGPEKAFIYSLFPLPANGY